MPQFPEWVRHSLMHHLFVPGFHPQLFASVTGLKFVIPDTLGLCFQWVSNLYEPLDHVASISVNPTIPSMWEAHLDHLRLNSLHKTAASPILGPLEKGSGFHLPQVIPPPSPTRDPCLVLLAKPFPVQLNS